MHQLVPGISIVTGVVLGVGQTSASAAPAASEPVPAPVPAGSATGELNIDNTGFPGRRHGPQDMCVFTTNGDYVHISSSAFEASGRGWWRDGDCPTTMAIVTVQPQEYYSDGRWRNKGTVGSMTVKPGGGADSRATGRAGCDNRGRAGWRSVVDVDLVGVVDDPRELTTPARNIGCTRR